MLVTDPGSVRCSVSTRRIIFLVSFIIALPGHQPLPQRSRFSFFSFHPCQVLANKSHLWVEEEVWRMEIYLSLGVLALGTLSLLAVTSLPSIANSLNWREFSFVQVK